MPQIPGRSAGTDRPSKVRLIIHLGLSGEAYAPEYLFGPDEYVDPRFVRESRKKLAELALAAAQRGQLPGGLGLEYAQSDLFLGDISGVLTVVHHGSPYTLDVIRPRQAAFHHPVDPTKPYRFVDDKPAICASRAARPRPPALLRRARA